MAIHSAASCFKNVSFHPQTSGPYRCPAASLSRPSTVVKASAFSSLALVAFPRFKLQGTTTTLLHHGILSVANAVSYHRFCFPCGKKKERPKEKMGRQKWYLVILQIVCARFFCIIKPELEWRFRFHGPLCNQIVTSPCQIILVVD